MEPYEALRGAHQLPAGELEQPADGLWRVAHQATGHTLATLGDKLRDTGKRLAKRLRTAANKARSDSEALTPGFCGRCGCDEVR